MGQVFFCGVHYDENIVKKSSSGGAFTAISDVWLSKFGDNAVIYGCAMDNDLKAKHIRATDSEGRNQMRGSKYIFSDTADVYPQVAQDIHDGKYILFSGTPCQIAAVKSYLNSKNIKVDGRLFTVDLICHGVADTGFFNDYISHLENKYKSKAISCSFREKNRLGKRNAMKVVFENNKKYISPSTNVDWFYTAYYRNLIIRPVCFNCKYASTERVSDITLGDYWGSPNALNWGESLIICNTESGISFAEELCTLMNIAMIDFDVSKQPQLCEAAKKPDNYDDFYNLYREKGYLAAQKYIGNNTAGGYVKYFVTYVLDKLKLIVLLKKIKGMIS